MNDTDVSIDERIRSFAASVRRHLDDLPEDELDEILGGLTADLAEQAADNGGVLELGDPADYAEELRSAAGFPPRGEAVKRPPFGERFTAWRRGIADGIRRNPFGAWLLDLLVSLRPVWWVLRGFAMFALAKLLIAILPPWAYTPFEGWALPSNALEWLLLLGVVVVSVQWGRGRWVPQNPLRHLRPVTSILAVLVLPLAAGSVLSPRVEYIDTGYQPQGLMLDGVQINNIFAYDSEGNPIDQVQLFTGKGTPINLLGSSYEESAYWTQDDGWTASIPLRDYRDRPVWNVYPLDEAELSTTTGEPKKSTIARPELPFPKAPDIRSTEPTPTPSPAPGVTEPQPTETPAP
ncbi:putative membrane protein [Microbacterium sp. HM58-2]|nr:putative membrane protein [Microbacterium sp. HM58-2]